MAGVKTLMKLRLVTDHVLSSVKYPRNVMTLPAMAR